MAPHDHPNGDTLDFPAEPPAARLDRLWRHGDAPDLEEFLASCGQLPPAELAAVLRVDQRERWRLGRPVPVDDYLARHPRAADDPEAALDLVYGEFLLREQHGPAPRLDEYLDRFPPFAAALKAQVELHRALQHASALVPPDPNAETRSHGGDTQLRPAAPVVPGYEILGELGRGGMGVVYEARHLKLKRLVAVKMLLAGAAARPQELARFRTEAEAAARLRHPNIVQVYEVGEADGRPFLAMELIDGGSLKAALGGVPRPDRWSAELVRVLAGAVHYGHAQGVVHRDLKPSNVLLARRVDEPPDGPQPSGSSPALAETPKITDFGLAKQLWDQGSQPDATRTGDVLGTPSYMSPEQAAGKAGDVGPETDVYALGSILYELLTGRPPFQADTPIRTIQQVVTDEPVSPSQLQRRLPRDLVTVCLKCLQKEPRKRYATAADLAADLGRFLAGEPILARPIGRPERAARWVRRNPGLAGLFTAIAALLVVIAVGSFVAAVRLRESAIESGKHAKRAEDNASESLWQTKLTEARAARFADKMGRRFAGAAALREATAIRPAAELRDEAIAGMALHDLRQAKTWAFPAGARSGIGFSGDMTRYVCVFPSPPAFSVRRVEDDTELYRVRVPVDPQHVILNRDGTLAAATTERAVEVWRLTGGEPARALRADDVAGGENNLPAIDFAPDGRTFATGHTDGTLRLHDLGTGQQVRTVRLSGRPRHVAFDRAGKKLAVTLESSVQVRAADTGKLLAELECDGGASCTTWHPGGRLLAVRGGDHVGVWDMPDRRRTTTIPCTLGGFTIAFSGTGEALVGAGWGGVVRVWEPGSGVELLRATLPSLAAFQVPPAGPPAMVELADGHVRLLELVPSPTYRVLPARTRGASYGRSIATTGAARGRLLAVGHDHGVYLIDLATSTEVGFLPIGDTRAVEFDGAGALWTNSFWGVRRWPVADEPGGGVRVGPPERFLVQGSINQIACSRDGSVAAVAGFNGGAYVIRRDRSTPALPLLSHYDCRYVAVSPGGEWVATGSHWGTMVKVWDARTGTVVRELPVGPSWVAFSPDGRWLVTTGAGVQLWDSRTWEKGLLLDRAFPTNPPFSPDGRTVAVTAGGNLLRLHDTASGRAVAEFSLPFPIPIDAGYMAYSSAGGRIVAAGVRSTHVWDLNAAGRELAALGLPWEVPPVERPPAATPLRVTVDAPTAEQQLLTQLKDADRALAKPNPWGGWAERRRFLLMKLGRYEEAAGDLGRSIQDAPTTGHHVARAECYWHLGRHADAIASLRAARWARPPGDEAVVCNALAWYLVTGPEELRDADEAVTLAARAVRLAPGKSTYTNTLGVALYRAGRYDEAVPHLRRSLRETDPPAHDLFFLAMCYFKLGDAQAALDFHSQAVYWMGEHAPTLRPWERAELEAIQREAQLLGLR